MLSCSQNAKSHAFVMKWQPQPTIGVVSTVPYRVKMDLTRSVEGSGVGMRLMEESIRFIWSLQSWLMSALCPWDSTWEYLRMPNISYSDPSLSGGGWQVGIREKWWNWIVSPGVENRKAQDTHKLPHGSCVNVCVQVCVMTCLFSSLWQNQSTSTIRRPSPPFYHGSALTDIASLTYFSHPL